MYIYINTWFERKANGYQKENNDYELSLYVLFQLL